MTKTAVVLFNLGGPDSPHAVRPFLYNLFNDSAIIPWRTPFRQGLAWLISTLRAPKAKKLYEFMGGGSPILPNTQAQAQALEEKLGSGYRVFIGMRYWHPFVSEAAQAVRAGIFDKVVLLPLYPQFSTTTTGSSVKEWARHKVNLPTTEICCYPTHPLWIKAQVALIQEALNQVAPDRMPHILFSAHGLPQSIVDGGDPYEYQVNQTVQSVMAQINGIRQTTHQVCFQSRVGPKKWLGPSTPDEIARGAQMGSPVILVPISFVSEHVETLVELDREYGHLAQTLGIQQYIRVPTVSTHPLFIDALADLVVNPLQNRLCPYDFCRCGFFPQQVGAECFDAKATIHAG